MYSPLCKMVVVVVVVGGYWGRIEEDYCKDSPKMASQLVSGQACRRLNNSWLVAVMWSRL